MTVDDGKRVENSIEASPRDWLLELRAPFLTASVVPVLVGGAMAFAALEELDLALFLVTMVGVVLLHLGANVTNDYWDFMGGTDVVNRYRTPFSGGSGLLVERRLSPRKVLRLGQALLAAGALVGLYLVYRMGEDGWIVLLLGMIGVGGAYFYSAPPLSLASRGVGELVIGSLFGLLAVLGTYFIQARVFTLEALAVSIPVSLWIAAVIWVNQFPDMEADSATGKRTMVVRLGTERSVAAYSAMQVSAAGVIVAAVILNLMPMAALIALIAMVPAGIAISVLGRSHGLYPDMIPAQRMTIVAHLVGGLLLCVGVLV
jgi:1,4-dihydroxy-2-naphthoate octaprenyltransferase